jgi:hypothetical protein
MFGPSIRGGLIRYARVLDDTLKPSATCPKCGWTPNLLAPTAEAGKLKQLVATGLTDRFQRFKDATIGAILHKAAEADGRADLKSLMKMIQLSKLDSLESVLTDDLVAFLRKLLYDENLVQEEVLLGPIVQAVGAIEEDRIDEAVEKFAGLLRKAVKDAKAQHGKGKRVRVFLACTKWQLAEARYNLEKCSFRHCTSGYSAPLGRLQRESYSLGTT